MGGTPTPEAIGALLAALPAGDASLARVFALLRAAHDVDFTLYRRSTVERRLARRMALRGVGGLREYLALLEALPAEVEALHQDLLIKVTQFFRDPETFAALGRDVFPALLEKAPREAPIRVWVPGCSTGEEVYSLAVALLEAMGDRPVPFQIFGTDVSEAALETARSGAYPDDIAEEVSPERLRRFFTQTGERWQLRNGVRERCIFARHDVARDPPFSRLDLISCRNVLIYLEPALQGRVVSGFHYALAPGGHLVLGTAETIGGLTELFATVDRASKLFVKKSVAPAGARRSSLPPPARGAWVADAQREADRLVMDRYAPPGVIVDEELQIVQFRGHTGLYLEPAPGGASLGVLKMVREGLAHELRAALHRARRSDLPARAEGTVGEGERRRVVGLEVIPHRSGAEGGERWFLVLFHSSGPGAGPSPRAPDEPRVARLERELAAARDYLDVTVEEQEATHEELHATNEELLSTNEALQTLNEELEAAREDLQSVNEELTTLNQELAVRNAELVRLNAELVDRR